MFQERKETLRFLIYFFFRHVRTQRQALDLHSLQRALSKQHYSPKMTLHQNKQKSTLACLKSYPVLRDTDLKRKALNTTEDLKKSTTCTGHKLLPIPMPIKDTRTYKFSLQFLSHETRSGEKDVMAAHSVRPTNCKNSLCVWTYGQLW